MDIWCRRVPCGRLCGESKTNKDLLYMNELFEAGKIKPVIDGPYKLNEFVEAFRLFGKAAHKGKVVITM